MKVTGFLLREAIRRWELRRDTAANQFEDSLKRFPDDDKPTPEAVVAAFSTAETNIASLQAAQARYNLRINLDVLGAEMTLCEAVKRLGGAGRLDKMWRTAAGGKKDRYGYRDDNPRKTDEIRATPTVTVKAAMEYANKASAWAGALRAAIAKGNGTEVSAGEIGLNAALLTE